MEETEHAIFRFSDLFLPDGIQPFRDGRTASRESSRSRVFVEPVRDPWSGTGVGSEVYSGRRPTVRDCDGGSELGTLEKALWRRNLNPGPSDTSGCEGIHGDRYHARMVCVSGAERTVVDSDLSRRPRRRDASAGQP